MKSHTFIDLSDRLTGEVICVSARGDPGIRRAEPIHERTRPKQSAPQPARRGAGAELRAAALGGGGGGAARTGVALQRGRVEGTEDEWAELLMVYFCLRTAPSSIIHHPSCQ